MKQQEFTFGIGICWITGGETKDGKDLSTSETLHFGNIGDFSTLN